MILRNSRTNILSVAVLALALLAVTCTAFTLTPRTMQHQHRVVLKVADGHGDDVDVHAASTTSGLTNRLSQVVTATAVAVMTSPLVAIAEEAADEYEYGAVNAPIGIAWAAGCLAILTALLPIALQGGEEAFEEIRKSDEGVWGTGKTSALDRKRRR